MDSQRSILRAKPEVSFHSVHVHVHMCLGVVGPILNLTIAHAQKKQASMQSGAGPLEALSLHSTDWSGPKGLRKELMIELLRVLIRAHLCDNMNSSP